MSEEATLNAAEQSSRSNAGLKALLDAVPAVPGAKLFGHMHLFKDDAQRLGLLRSAAAVGAVSKMRFLHRSVLVASSPETAREVLVEQASIFEKSPGLRILLRPLAGDGLFTSEGALWKQQRRVMSPLFHASQLAGYTTAMNDVTRRTVERLRDGESLDLARLMTRITMGIVGSTLFGTETFEATDDLGEALTTALQWVDEHLTSNFLALQLSLIESLEKARPRIPAPLEEFQRRIEEALREPVFIPGAGAADLSAAIRTLDKVMQNMIGERRSHPQQRVDLLSKLLLARDTEVGHSTEGMSDAQVRDEANTLFVAGHETTANALAWAFYLLARHPEARAKVQAEADTFGPEGVTTYDPARLAYTTRVFKEALRLYPPLIMLPRRALEPFTLGGERYPAGMVLFVNLFAIHHHPDVWPDPERFDPDRFLPEKEATRHKGAWLPFGVGPRVCIGNAFALMEGPIVMATLMRNLRVDINPSRTIEPDAFATLRPKGGVPAVVHKR